MVQTNPTPFEVGRAFVHQYYTLLHQAPELLHRFYSTDSTFIHGGVDRPGSIEQPAVGPESISKRINDLNLRECHAKIRQVDSHPTIGLGVVVQVTGELSNNGDQMRRFMQTFVLAPRQPKKYYVQNDIFRYQDEVFEDGSDEDDRSGSQVCSDTDKVFHSEPITPVVQQQPSMVSVPSQAPIEVPQPLPPRQQRANHQPSVTPNATVPQQEFKQNGIDESAGYKTQPEVAQVSQGEQQQQQRPKQIPGETSYARIAKSNPSSGVAPTGSNPAPVPTASVPPPNPNRPSNPPARPSGNNYQQQQNNRPQQWTDNTQQENRPNPGPPAPPNEQQVFVGSLPPEFTRETLIKCFSQFGRVIDAKIHAPARDNKKNFGFVVFDDASIAASVVKMEHVTYEDVRLNVEPKTTRNYSNSNYGPRGNNYQSRGGGRGGNNNRPPYRGNGYHGHRGGHYGNHAVPFNGADESQSNNQVQQ